VTISSSVSQEHLEIHFRSLSAVKDRADCKSTVHCIFEYPVFLVKRWGVTG